MLRRLVRSTRRSLQVAGAFFRLGLQQDLSYPMGFVTNQLSGFLPVFIFFFVAKLVDRPGYFSFVLIGLAATRLVDAGVKGFSTEIDIAINRGWLEMFLVEPVHWRLLPVSMVQWRAVQGVTSAALMIGIGLLLGARFDPAGIVVGSTIIVLGLIAGLAIGTLSASLKVLAKQGDPILFIYGLFVQIFSGVYFPLEVLPGPIRWISWLIPHTYVITALRGVLLPATADAPTMSAGQALLALSLFCVVVFPIALWAYGRALEYGRKLGVLSGY
jgi:ABC-2 type transport system permease protein